MLYDVYNLFLAIPKIRKQHLGLRGVRLFFSYARLRLKRWFLAATKRTCTQENFFGFRIAFFDYEAFVYLVEEIFIHGIYRFHTTKEAPLIFDCGSNVGVAILYFKSLYPKAKIVAFEPDQSVFALLKANVENNHLQNVQLHNLALSDTDGTITFHRESSGSLCASIMEHRTGAAHHSVSVDCARLSPLIQSPIDYMKMDIEGAEIFCIPELAKSKRLEAIRELVIECHHNVGEKNVFTTVLSALEGSGFIYQIGAQTAPPSKLNSSQDIMIYAGKDETLFGRDSHSHLQP